MEETKLEPQKISQLTSKKDYRPFMKKASLLHQFRNGESKLPGFPEIPGKNNTVVFRFSFYTYSNLAALAQHHRHINIGVLQSVPLMHTRHTWPSWHLNLTWLKILNFEIRSMGIYRFSSRQKIANTR